MALVVVRAAPRILLWGRFMLLLSFFQLLSTLLQFIANATLRSWKRFDVLFRMAAYF